LFDVDWSPIDPTLLLTANGDGSVAVWKWENGNGIRKPLFLQRQHNKEVYSAQWEPTGMRSYHFLSASWDNSVKIWNLNTNGLTCLTSLIGHESIVYSGSWNPKMSGILLSVSADKTFRLWDVNSSSLSSSSIFVSPVNSSDIICCDWNKYETNLFALGYASGLIELRDFRNLKEPVLKSIEMAHDYGIRNIRFSPHIPTLFGSVSYDMHTKLWHTTHGLLDESKNHNEFAYGFDFDPKIPNRLVDCGWDRKVIISEFNIQSIVH
jgi:peroxin-7